MSIPYATTERARRSKQARTSTRTVALRVLVPDAGGAPTDLRGASPWGATVRVRLGTVASSDHPAAFSA
eukprot:scaffold610257_cov15-Prasinocladus_malaysianus.AAC.1